MLIGIDASRANRKYKSGTEWYSYYLIKQLAWLDSKNQYILYTDKPLQKELADLGDSNTSFSRSAEEQAGRIDKKGYQTVKSPYNNFTAKVLEWPFTYFWTLGRLSWEMLFGKKPDILFVPAHGLPYFHPKRSIVTIHDVAFRKAKKLYRVSDIGAESKGGKRLINFFVTLFTLGKYGATSLDYLNWSTTFSLRRAKKIITVSKFSKQEILENYKCDPDKIKVIYNGYNNNIYRKINNKQKIERKLDKYGLSSPYILYVGRLERKKNIPALVEAFGIAKMENKDFSCKLVLVGAADYGYDEIKCLIEEYSLNSKVLMPGWIEERDMPYIYNGATAFVFPSRHEGFGIPVLQSLACGVPVAASYITPLREVGGDAALYFDPYDVESISGSLQKITMNKQLREKLIAKGYDRVKYFSWKKTAEKTLKEINDL
ncbi:MAG: glycosyltransferase family 4 protein [Patescibacteria group bacterium]